MTTDTIQSVPTIAIIGPSQKFLSGISYFTLRLSNALADFSHVKVILFRNMLPRYLFPGWKRVGNGLMKHHFREGVENRELLDWYNPVSWIRGASIAETCDVIIFQWWTSSIAHMYFAIVLLNWKKKPVIIEFHEIIDPLEHGFFVLRMYSMLMGTLIRKMASLCVVHSEVDLRLISSHYHISENRIRVIPHGLYDQYDKLDCLTARQHLGLSGQHIILFFGLLRPYKGVKYLIKAFEQLPPDILRDSHLLIVGEAWEDNESRHLVEQSRVRDNITLINRYVGDDEVPFFFSAADMLVIPYTRASQSGVAHIGMAYGLPVIASDVGGLFESLSKYSGTRFVRPENVGDLVEALLQAMRDPRVYEPPEELRWERTADQWRILIAEILGNRT
jgi:glycosyltransferase involved in cell wall biosynthesis